MKISGVLPKSGGVMITASVKRSVTFSTLAQYTTGQQQGSLFPLSENIAGSGVFDQMLTNSVRAKLFTGML